MNLKAPSAWVVSLLLICKGDFWVLGDNMANRRMFSKDITSSDSFLSMSATAQNLYFHLGMEADDDGFVPHTKIIKMLGTSHDDTAQLLGRKFLIQFPFGVFVVRDWKVNNQIRPDRYKPTIYQDELAQLGLNSSGQYFLLDDNKNGLGIPNGNQMTTVGKPSIGKDSIGKDSIERETPTLKYNSYKKIDEELIQKISQDYEVPTTFVKDVKENMGLWLAQTGKKYKDYNAALRNWVKKDRARYMIEAKKANRSNKGGLLDARDL